MLGIQPARNASQRLMSAALSLWRSDFLTWTTWTWTIDESIGMNKTPVIMMNSIDSPYQHHLTSSNISDIPGGAGMLRSYIDCCVGRIFTILACRKEVRRSKISKTAVVTAV